jgi:hypothetical protein
MTIREILTLAAGGASFADADVGITFENSNTTANEYIPKVTPIKMGGSCEVEVIPNDD